MANKKLGTWKDYQNMLKMNKMNMQAEIASINQKAMSGIESYRKALGLQGSGAGESVNAQLGVAQAQALAQANAQNQINEENARQSYSNSMTEAYKNLLATGSYKDAEAWRKANVDESGLAPGTNAIWEAYQKASGSTWDNDKQYQIESLREQINSGTLDKNQQYEANSIINQLSGAQTQQEYDSLLERYKDVLGVANGYSNIAKDLDPSTFDVSSLDVADAQKVGSKQDLYASAIMDAYKRNPFPDGTAIELNYGNVENSQIAYFENGRMRLITQAELDKLIKEKKTYGKLTFRDVDKLKKLGVNITWQKFN